jgi:hypothetical protein
MTKIAGSGSISQRHGSADPDPDPPQNVMDPQHWQSQAFRIRSIRTYAFVPSRSGHAGSCCTDPNPDPSTLSKKTP